MSENLFNASFYRAANNDLARFNDAQLQQHFQNYGLNEGRRFSALVDLNFYRASNSDLANFSNRQAYDHLSNYGVNEGRKFSPFVDLKFYLANNSDVNQAFGGNKEQGFQHLVSYGVAEGRKFSTVYDSAYYKAANSDLAAAGLNNVALLQHFEFYGLNEGRASSASFNVQFYRNYYADLKSAGFNYQQALQHYINYGIKEGRIGVAGATPYPSGDPGNLISSALNIGTLTNAFTYDEFVGINDKNDYYRFSINSTSNVNVTVNGLTESIDLRLIQDTNKNGQFDSYGEDISYYDSGNSYEAASINKTLGAGTYFIRVNPYFNDGNTNYTISLSASITSPTTPRDPGNTLTTALPISSGQSFNEFVGIGDKDDYYRFTINSTKNVNVTVDGLTESIDLRLIQDTNNNGQFDSYGEDISYYDSGNSYEAASITKTLGTGTYFIRVNPYSNDGNTNYTVRLTAQ